MEIKDDWLIKKMFDKLVEALDELLEEIEDSGLLKDETFRNWTSKLYALIDKYDND